ncbi:MAG: hypothetical protein H0V47_08635 [Chloroflexia bacterium]|nr:hypothetical protein [Chloroflexia bacterium]
MSFYPGGAPVLDELRTSDLLLRMLTTEHAEMDYEAVMESQEQLRRFSAGSWPTPDFTLEQNIEDLEEHEREHHERIAFTYTVMNPDATRCEGCVYINPWQQALAHRFIDATMDDVAIVEHEAVVTFWIRESSLERELDRQLVHGLLDWFDAEWSFSRITFMTNDRLERQMELLEDAALERRYSFGSETSDLTWTFYSQANT